MRGVVRHNMDAKGRVSFPARFREEMGEGFILSKGLGKCLWAMTVAQFEAVEDKIAALPVADAQKLQYYFAANFDVEVDGQGRILVPPELRTFAGLGKETTFIGFQNRVELWDSAEWNAASDMDSSDALRLLGDVRLF